jgi:predicted Zn-dependent protease
METTQSRFRVRLLGMVLTAALISAGAGCATSPTGRSQLMLMPDGQMNQMGAQAFQQLKQETPVEPDSGMNRYVRCVAQPIADLAGPQAGISQWEIVVFRDETANAFALPGGKIGVHTGLLKVAKTDGQLAAVLGHEVGHVIARHGAERMSQALATQGGLAALGAVTKDNRTLLGLLGLGAQVGVLLPFSRTQESEADVIGLDLMARVGFDPRQSVELWHNMASASGGKSPPEFLSTHPANQSRIDHLNENMADAVGKYDQARASGHTPRCAR